MRSDDHGNHNWYKHGDHQRHIVRDNHSYHYPNHIRTNAGAKPFTINSPDNITYTKSNDVANYRAYIIANAIPIALSFDRPVSKV